MYIYIYIRKDTDTDGKANKTKQKPTVILTKLCWNHRCKVPVLSTCCRCDPEGFIVATFYKLKHIANNHDNNNNNNRLGS